MKNKKILIIIVLAVVVVIVGFFAYQKYNLPSLNSKNEILPYLNIKDALEKNISLYCEFNSEDGSFVKSYIKNGAVRISSTNADEVNQTGEVIMVDGKMYMWDLTTKKGLVYVVPDQLEENEESNMDQSENYLSLIDSYKDSCKVTTVEDSYFELPDDVDFQDMSKLLENLQNNIPQYQEVTE